MALEPALHRAVELGRVDADLAAAWLTEQCARDAAGAFSARWVKTRVVARRR